MMRSAFSSSSLVSKLFVVSFCISSQNNSIAQLPFMTMFSRRRVGWWELQGSLIMRWWCRWRRRRQWWRWWFRDVNNMSVKRRRRCMTGRMFDSFPIKSCLFVDSLGVIACLPWGLHGCVLWRRSDIFDRYRDLGLDSVKSRGWSNRRRHHHHDRRRRKEEFALWDRDLSLCPRDGRDTHLGYEAVMSCWRPPR